MPNSPYTFSTINQQTNQVLISCSVTIYLSGTTTKANIYNSSGSSLSNPVNSDSSGLLKCYLADGQLYDVVWSQGSYTSETITVGNNNQARIKVTSPITMQVGFPGAYDSATSTNCFTVQQALYNLMNNYDHQGFTPTIQCAGPTSAGGSNSLAVYNNGFVISFSDNPGAAPTPSWVGTFMLILDLGGSILDGGPRLSAGSFTIGHTYTIQSVGTTDFTLIGASANTVGKVFTATGVGTGTGTAVGGTGYTVCIRMDRLALQIQNGTFQQCAGLSSILYSYGGGAHIEIGPSVTLGQFGPDGGDAGGAQFVCQATRDGAIRLRPGLSGAYRMNINLGTGNTIGALFVSLITAGSIELEGAEIHLSGSTTLSVAIFLILNVSDITLSNVAWTGSLTALLGPQFIIKSGGSLTNNDSTGGQSMIIPANPQTGASQTNVTTNTFTAVAGSNYLPGSQPGYIVGNNFAIDFWPDLPPASSSAGTSFTAGAFTVGHSYTITSLGTTDFTLIGASANRLGNSFVATGVGSGTGTARDYVIQGAEPAITFGIGSGATSPITLPLATTTNWRNAICTTNNPGALANFIGTFTSPSGSTPGYLTFSWTGTYSGAALGAYIFVQLSNGIPQ